MAGDCAGSSLGRDADMGRRRRGLWFGSDFYDDRTHSPSHRKDTPQTQIRHRFIT
nr:4-11 CRISPR MLO11 [Cucumis sativus]